MKNLARRILLAVVAAVLLLGTFLPCALAADEPVKLSFWHWWSGPEEQYLLGVLADFTEATGIEVETLPVQDTTKIMTAIAGGTPPDLCMLTNRAQLYEIANNGGALALNAYMDRDGITMDDFLPSVKADYTIDGVVYGLPFLGFNDALFWNKTLFEEAGLDPDTPPTTMEEVAEYARRLTKVEDGSIVQLGFYPNGFFIYFVDLFGGKYYDAEQGRFTIDSDECVQTIEWMRSINSDLDPQEVVNFIASCGADLTPDAPFESGRVAMEYNGCWKVAFNAMNVPDLPYGTAAMPASEAHPEAAMSNILEYNPHFVPSGSEHPDEAWALISWLCCDKEVAANFGEFCANFSHLKELPEGFESSLFGDPRFQVFLDLANSENAHSLPLYESANECDALISTAVEELMMYPELDAAQRLGELNDELNAIIGA